VSRETAYEKARAIAVDLGRSLDQVMTEALIKAAAFNRGAGALDDDPDLGITYAGLEDALDDYGIDSTVFRAFVEDAQGVGLDDPDAVVTW
jgi:hypothetical protein